MGQAFSICMADGGQFCELLVPLCAGADVNCDQCIDAAIHCVYGRQGSAFYGPVVSHSPRLIHQGGYSLYV